MLTKIASIAGLIVLLAGNAPAQTILPQQGTNNTKQVVTEPATYHYNLENITMESILTDPRIGWVGLTSRTVLQDPTAIPALRRTVTFKSPKPLTKTEAIKAIETILSTNGIVLVHIDEKTSKAVLIKK